MTNGQENDFQDENLENLDQTSAQGSTEELSLEEKLQNELANANDKYTRLFAEFDNYKKRTSKEKVELIQSASKDVLNKLLPVLDDFDRALAAMQTTQEVEAVKEGVELVNQKFRKTLTQEGLKEMENLIGQPFDPEFQEAITAIPAPTEDLKNKVIDVVEKGYFLNDKVVRFAKVVIGQ
ncbi:nucleotide exchange factor GrpE [Sphingobacterium psychroaquaticum]|uniref:Protein GrpE n=1 Tax=Sphingobacterium psychroaquaticum TaxID=561061 RepID=A0A1X7I767_9SPHI|nr:nucleotide exchange factor GrpE [Sphingobacterium psychroaquaticum]QBQ41851.1 nucleotide exchange factor GrpE [Sphingobacterium psychroaquaticum]SMG10445.1 molecular chaperone GrpE [Sphingobacterium psychroaquaticum]